MQVCNVFVCANQSRVRELSHALTCPVWANSERGWCPSLLLVISPFKATSGCVPKSAQTFLSFVLIGLFLEDAGCVKSEHGYGRAGVLPPSISILRQLSILCPLSHAWWKEVTERDWKWFSQEFADTLLCLRSAGGGCSWTSSRSAKTHLFSHLLVLVKTVVFWICLAVRQTSWASTEWFTGQPGDEESASSLYSTVSAGSRRDSTADTHKPITLSYLILTPSKLLSMSNQPFRNRPLKWKACV